ncbi:L-dehydroascorbate transporter large permease subunit [Citrobacter amalonaticus]|uniref:TRAP transporter large permease protein n=1 Tax=Citrobacter amalonaticus TaxID=35703 RepID=A0A2S4RVK2_CITAM|nr:TRAP transporter large permease subunit [Citrobacter amalonaticus]POT56325.1 L-dehydroascorbate transporter large permease subunit [Citrobacter amalonaticus]POT74850.1 L-dehydroascorbate transporter large permease subunit [Citrobacter amalonaticus]POU64379.1 L-dehydroascorbate transporter large permease subunit [Citrobacter amalonaticus]POV04215.1 L-dehydroascorbate transporter large permease subunit [Citrobacter amalonaticus]
MTLAIFLGVLAFGIIIGMPISFALLLSGVAMMWQLDMFDAQLIAQNAIDGTNNFVLLAAPFFILAGEVMNAGGLSKRIIRLAMAFVGHVPGGLGYVAIFAAMLMASLSGSALADTTALAAMLLPMMREAGYNMNRSAGLIVCGGVIAPVLPPSIPLILFGVAAQVSITKLFIGGVIPGVMMGISILAAWWLVSRKDADTVVYEKKPRSEAISAFKDGVWALILPLIILFGLKFGIFTPTEAGVIAAAYSLFVGCFIYKELKLKDIYRVLLNAGKMTAMVMFLVAGAMVTSWLITVADLPGQLVGLLEPFIEHPRLFMLMLVLVLLVVGLVIDMTPLILIMAPVLMPVVTIVGIDPVYFGVVFVMTSALGLITPPIGTSLNAACSIGNLRIEGVSIAMLPFLLAEIGVVLLLVIFPEIITIPLSYMF